MARHPRFQFHFTPTYSAWLNLVERFFGLLTEHALKRGSHSSTHALRHDLRYVDAHNDEGKPFKSADEILAKVNGSDSAPFKSTVAPDDQRRNQRSRGLAARGAAEL